MKALSLKGADMKATNETYEIEVTSPLLRPGLTIRTTVSKKYLVLTLNDLMDQVRQFNTAQGGCKCEDKKDNT